MKISTDKSLNPALQKEVQSLRGIFMDAAAAHPMPSRFVASCHPDKPAMIITDTSTSKQATVPLFAYGEVRSTLYTLFGD